MAVVDGGMSVSDAARRFGVSRRWVQVLVSRYRAEGQGGLTPRSRRPHTSPGATEAATRARVLGLRDELDAAGLDAGAESIRDRLAVQGLTVPSTSTIYRILRAGDRVTPQPHKRPRSSWTRFQAPAPNSCWQSDMTHWHLTHTAGVEIISWLDCPASRFLAGPATRWRTTSAPPPASSATAPPRVRRRQRSIPNSLVAITGGPRTANYAPRRSEPQITWRSSSRSPRPRSRTASVPRRRASTPMRRQDRATHHARCGGTPPRGERRPGGTSHSGLGQSPSPSPESVSWPNSARSRLSPSARPRSASERSPLLPARMLAPTALAQGALGRCSAWCLLLRRVPASWRMVSYSHAAVLSQPLRSRACRRSVGRPVLPDS